LTVADSLMQYLVTNRNKSSRG